jgi:hypothetical protein
VRPRPRMFGEQAEEPAAEISADAVTAWKLARDEVFRAQSATWRYRSRYRFELAIARRHLGAIAH